MRKSNSNSKLFKDLQKQFEESSFEVIETYRTSQAFNNDIEWNNLVLLTQNTTDPFIQKRMKEFRQWRALRDQVKSQRNEMTGNLKQYELVEFLCLLAIYWEKNRLETIFLRGGDFVPFEQTYASAFGQLIKAFLRTKPTFPKETDPDRYQEVLFQVLGKCNSSAYWDPFEEIVGAFIQEQIYFEQQSLYSFRNYQMIFMGVEGFQLYPLNRESENRWNRIGQQYRKITGYYLNAAKALAIQREKDALPKISPITLAEMLYWNDLGFPEEVEVKGNKINPRNVLHYLSLVDRHQTDAYLLPANSAFVNLHKSQVEANTFDFIGFTISKAFVSGKNIGPLAFRTKNEFLQQTFEALLKHEDFEPENIEPSFDFLSWKLDTPYADKQRVNLLEQPFIRFGEMVCWLPGILGQKNHAVGLQNRLLKYWIKEKDTDSVQQKNKGLDDVIVMAFENAGFNIRKEYDLWTKSEGKITDVDLFAWKGNSLFVIQVKDTFARYTPVSIQEYREKIEKAGTQLDKCMKFLEEREKKSQVFKDLDITSPPQDVQLIPLIVTSTPEGNYERWGEGKHPKVGVQEFKIILSNSDLLLRDIEVEKIVGATGDRDFAERFMQRLYQNPNNKALQNVFIRIILPKEQEIEAHFNQFKGLWKDPQNCTAADIMEAIEEDKVWRELIQVSYPDLPSENDSPEIHEAYILYQQGQYFFNQQNFKSAIAFLEKALSSHPAYLEAKHLLTDAYAEDDQKDRAIHSYSDIIQKYPDGTTAYLNRAATYWELKKSDQALQDLDEVLRIEPDNQVGLIHKIVISLEMGKELEVVAEIEKALKLFPNDPRLLTALGKFEEKVLQLTPETAEDKLHLAGIWFLKGKISKALDWVNEVIDLEPKMVAAWHNRGWYKMHQELKVEAIPDLEKACELDPSIPDYWDILGNALADLGQNKDAHEAYQKAIDAAPLFWRAWYNLGVLYMKTGSLKEALTCYEKAASICNTHASIFVNAAAVAYQLGEKNKALQYYQKAFVAGDDNCLTLWMALKDELAEGA